MFGFAQPPHPRGHDGPIGDQVHRLVGVRFADEPAGFAVSRFAGAIEVWGPVEDTWHEWHRLSAPGRGVLTGFGSRLVMTVRRGIEVWDLESVERIARGELDTPFDVLAPVRIGQRTVVAAAFREYGECGVQLWDPQNPTGLGEVFNRHGSAFGDPRFGSASIVALTGIAHPDGTVRVASAGNDGSVLISAPLGEHHLTPGESSEAASRPGGHSGSPQEGRVDYVKVRTPSGETVGLWFADTSHATDRGLVEAILFGQDLLHLLDADYRVEPNTVDDNGGAFVLFGGW